MKSLPRTPKLFEHQYKV